ncbi:13328_t:CDS:2, partial [Gigaspora rosea]
MNRESPNTDKKMCSHCYCMLNHENFCRPRGNNPLYEHATCNKCCEERKKKRKEIDVISSKRKQLEADSTNSVAVANSSQTDTDHMDFEQDSDCSEDLPQDLLHEDNTQTICQENDPWEKFGSVNVDHSIEELNSSSNNSQSNELIERNNTNDELEIKLTYYKKIFDSALMLYEREKDNVNFIKNFDNLLKPVVKAIEG